MRESAFARRASNTSAQQLPALKDRIANLNGWMEDVKAGERMTFMRIPGAGVQVDVGGAATSSSRDSGPHFAHNPSRGSARPA
jgi:hypothetical protein